MSAIKLTEADIVSSCESKSDCESSQLGLKLVAAPLSHPSSNDLERFNDWWARYLKAHAKCHQVGLSDEDWNSASDDQCEATWALIRLPAVKPYHVEWKLDALAAMLDGGTQWYDRRELMLLQSIRADVERLGELGGVGDMEPAN